MNRLGWPLLWIALLSTGAALLYFHELGAVTPYLSVEEVSQAREAVALSTTGRNIDGEWLPLYFPEDEGRTVRDPVWVYWAAALLTLLPYSDALVRAPSASAGVLNVVLMFIVCRELFGRTRPAVVAAVLLMLTPSHFLQSRIATMQIAPVTFVLIWLIFLVRYIHYGLRRDLVIASCCLGFGMYTYVAALVIMPAYFLLTLVVVQLDRGSSVSRTGLTPACAAFALTLVPLALWFAFHPAQVIGLTGYYMHGEYNKGLGVQGFLGAHAISHLDAWWDCYNLDKLFFSGDSDVRFSTRSAGFFLLATSVPMVIGIVGARGLLKFEGWVVLLTGLVIAPLPAALVSNSEIKRWLTFIPFAILATTTGVEWLIARTRIAKACVVALLLLSAIQAKVFLDYYFGPYRLVTADKLGGNLREAVLQILSVSAPEDCVFFAVGPYYIENQWDLYTRAYGRLDLATHRTTRLEHALSCRGATVLALPDDARFADWQSIAITELDGSVRFAVYHR